MTTFSFLMELQLGKLCGPAGSPNLCCALKNPFSVSTLLSSGCVGGLDATTTTAPELLNCHVIYFDNIYAINPRDE